MEIRRKTIGFAYEQGEMWEQEALVPSQREADMAEKIEWSVLSVYPQWTYQKVEGFGCALTGTSCILLSQMPPEQRRHALRAWFGEGGINARYIRLSIDSCDFSPYEYQAVPDPIADPELSTFSIREDQKLILPVVKEALSMAAADCEVLLSPWSPPGQWKTPPETHANDAAAYGDQAVDGAAEKPGRCRGGRLKKEYYAAWAKYVTLYVEAYRAEGIPVTMLSVQNEPDAATPWDSCLWSGEEEYTFLKDYLYPALAQAGLAETVGIFVWDHNKERMAERALEVLKPDALPLVKGMAYHWYTGDHFQAVGMVRERFPDIVLMHSESCPLHRPYRRYDPADETLSVADRQQDYADACRYAHDMLGDINQGMNRWIDWNLIVDRQGGPRHVPGGFAAPLLAERDGTCTETMMYRYIRLIAQSIPRDSVRLGVSCYITRVEMAALRCPDGSISLLLLNPTAADEPLTLRMDGLVCDVSAPAHSLSAFHFSPTPDATITNCE